MINDFDVQNVVQWILQAPSNTMYYLIQQSRADWSIFKIEANIFFYLQTLNLFLSSLSGGLNEL